MLNTITGLLGGATAPIVGDYESIATVLVGSGGTDTITFSSIPSDYKHLQVRYIARSAASNGSLRMTFNGDTGSNYSYHELSGDGSSASAGAATPLQFIFCGQYFNTANTFGTGIIDILDYRSTTKNKTVRMLTGRDENGTGRIFFQSGAWFNSGTAISTLTISRESTNTIAQHSQFALYGIKG